MKLMILIAVLGLSFMLASCKNKPTMEQNLFEQIPDSTFRAYCQRFDTNGDGRLSPKEARAVKEINLSSDFYLPDVKGIDVTYKIPPRGTVVSMEGIKLFPNLTSIDCTKNSITSLDVGGCTALKELNCADNAITDLNVHGCTALTTLHCGSNEITKLDLSGCKSLIRLNCAATQLTDLNVSGCTSLKWIVCSYTQIVNLNLSECMALKEFVCFDAPLTSLNVSGCTALESLIFNNTKLATLDVSNCTKLTKLSCTSCHLTDLDISGCKGLTYLVVRNNKDPLTLTVWPEFNSTDPYANPVLEYRELNSEETTIVKKNSL